MNNSRPTAASATTKTLISPELRNIFLQRSQVEHELRRVVAENHQLRRQLAALKGLSRKQGNDQKSFDLQQSRDGHDHIDEVQTEHARPQGNGSSSMDGHTARSNSSQDSKILTLKTELKNVRQKLRKYEHSELAIAKKLREALEENILLKTERNRLEERLGQPDSTYAKLKIDVLEKRLKLTADELDVDRSKRVERLNELESKLLSDNARLQVSEKELRRHLEGERERNRQLEERLNAATRELDETRLDTRVVSHSSHLLPASKSADRYEEIIRHLREENDVPLSNDEAVVEHLWQINRNAMRQLDEFEYFMGEMGITEGNVKQRLTVLRTTKANLDKRVVHLEERLADAGQAAVEKERTVEPQISNLVGERNKLKAEKEAMHFEVTRLRSENEMLQGALEKGAVKTKSLNGAGDSSSSSNGFHPVAVAASDVIGESEDKDQARVDLLEQENRRLQVDLIMATDKITRLEDEINERNSLLESLRSDIQLESSQGSSMFAEMYERDMRGSDRRLSIKSMDERVLSLGAESLTQRSEEPQRIPERLRVDLDSISEWKLKVDLLEKENAQKDEEIRRKNDQIDAYEARLREAEQLEMEKANLMEEMMRLNCELQNRENTIEKMKTQFEELLVDYNASKALLNRRGANVPRTRTRSNPRQVNDAMAVAAAAAAAAAEETAAPKATNGIQRDSSREDSDDSSSHTAPGSLSLKELECKMEEQTKEIVTLNDLLRQKDATLSEFSNVLLELNEEQRTRKELESKLNNSEVVSKNLQNELDQLRDEIGECHRDLEMDVSLDGAEKKGLLENYKRTMNELAMLKMDWTQLNARHQSVEATVDALKLQLQDETVQRKLNEERLVQSRTELETLRREKSEVDAKIAATQDLLSKTQAQLDLAVNSVKLLERTSKDSDAVARTHEERSNVLQEKLDALREDLNAAKMAHMAEREELWSKYRSGTQELTTKLEESESERRRLLVQLELAQRDEEATLHRENGLQRSQLEGRIRDAETAHHLAEERLRLELQKSSSLQQRIHELELENSKLKALVDLTQEANRDSMSPEVLTLLRELRLHSTDNEKVHSDMKKRVKNLEEQLSTERTLRSAEKEQILALEEDNSRLRSLLINKHNSTSPNRTRQNHRENVHERILRSQARAQQLLATANSGLDPFSSPSLLLSSNGLDSSFAAAHSDHKP